MERFDKVSLIGNAIVRADSQNELEAQEINLSLAAPTLDTDTSKGGETGNGEIPVEGEKAVPPSPPIFPPDQVSQVSDKELVTPTINALGTEQFERGGANNENFQRQVYFPKASVNPVLLALRNSGYYLADLGNCTHAIHCPKLGAHSGEGTVKTLYLEPSADYPVGQIFCQHVHDDGVSLTDLLAEIGVSYSVARHRPCIRFVQGELSAVLRAIETELAKLGTFFHTKGTLVSISLDQHGNTTLRPITEQMLLQVLATHVDFEKYDGRIKGFAPCDPQPRYVNMLLNKHDFEVIPQLNGIARQPYFLSDTNGSASICTNEGYNVKSGMLGSFCAQDYVLPEPTVENAKAALKLLSDLISEFHFVDPLDKAVALSAIFTAVFRPGIPLAPGFHVRAPVISSGKSLLCQLIGLFAGPESNKKISYPKSSEEATKVILSALLESPAVIEFDDMTHDWIAHGVINRLFTNEWITDRILGVSKMATVGTKVLVLGSGNNVGPIRDLIRRVLTCNLNPRCSNPMALAYKGNPLTLMGSNRAVYVVAVLTIAKAWMTAGSPKSDVSNIASFGGTWSDLCRHPLIWLGEADPAESFFEQLKKDQDQETLGRLLKQWHKTFGSTPKTLRVALEALDSNPDLQDAIAEFPVYERGEVNRGKLGWVLKRCANRIVNDLMFERIEASERTAWRVTSTAKAKTDMPVLPPPPPLTSLDESEY